MALNVGDIRVIYTHEHDSGLAQDRMVNVFHFSHTGFGPVDYGAAAQLCNDFYADAHAPGGAIRSSLAVTLSGAWSARVYDLVDPLPRVPKVTISGSYGVGAGALPEEIAVCLSYQGDAESGELQRRRRGRLYIGPLHNGVSVDSGTPRPNDTFRNLLAAAAIQLRDDAITNEYVWAVYSRADDAMVEVTNGWVDNAYDVQRRRGPDPTDRLLWPAP